MPPLVGAVDPSITCGRFEQRLRRDAAAEQARAAQPLVPLDQRDAPAEHRRPERRRVAAGAGAHDDQVVAVLRHPLEPPLGPGYAVGPYYRRSARAAFRHDERGHRTAPETELQHSPLEAEHRALGAKLGAVRRLAHAHRVPRGRSRSTRRSARRSGCSTSRTWASSSRRGPGALDRRSSATFTNDLSQVAGRRRPVQDGAERRRRDRRRPDRLPARRGALPRRAERRQRRDGLRVVRGAGRRRRGVGRAGRLDADRRPGPALARRWSARCSPRRCRSRTCTAPRRTWRGRARRSCPGAATRANAGSSCSSRRPSAVDLWRRSSDIGSPVRAGAARARARATPSGPRWATRCTATTSRRTERRSRPAWGGPSPSTRATSSDGTRWSAQREAGVPARLWGLRMEGRLIPRPHYAVLPRATSASARPRAGRSRRRSGGDRPRLPRRPARGFAPGDRVEVDVRGRRGDAERGQAAVRRRQPAIVSLLYVLRAVRQSRPAIRAPGVSGRAFRAPPSRSPPNPAGPARPVARSPARRATGGTSERAGAPCSPRTRTPA